MVIFSSQEELIFSEDFPLFSHTSSFNFPVYDPYILINPAPYISIGLASFEIKKVFFLATKMGAFRSSPAFC